MSNSFFPKVDAELVVWANNYKNKITANALVLGLSDAQVAQEINYCDQLIAAVNGVSIQKQALKAAQEAKLLAIEKQGGALRNEIARHKLNANYTDAIGNDLGVISHRLDFVTSSYKAKISVEMFAGMARLKFAKRGADGLNIYHRKKGTSAWQFMARVTKSPFDDQVVLEHTNQPEHWEYRAYGVVDDLEIGIASDIVEVIVGA
jgi:hypothetical protein